MNSIQTIREVVRSVRRLVVVVAEVVLDLDKTLVCAYETSSLPDSVRKQATDAGLTGFELESFEKLKRYAVADNVSGKSQLSKVRTNSGMFIPPIIPISLYVSIEMIKFIQSTKFVNNDLRMYHSETNTPALAHTSNLNEELVHVDYIFSDKTGTLIRNLMEFFKCSIGGEMYGAGVTKIELGAAKRSGVNVREVQKPSHTAREKGFNFNDDRLMHGAWRNEPNPDMCKEFFRCLAICHTFLPEGEETPEKLRYQAASPDEAALVTTAKNFGFFFYRRTPTMIYVRESVFCMSLRRWKACIVLQGADSVIYERLASGNDELKKISREQLEQYGEAGLRTLCLAYKDLSPDMYESWNEKYIQAKSSLRDRERKLDEVAELIEKDLTC